MKQLYQLRDDLADVLGVSTLEAHDSPMRPMLNKFLFDAQYNLYWQYRWSQLKGYFQFNTVAGMNLYPYTPGLVTWAAAENINVTDKLFDGTNYQQAGGTGATGANAPAWNAQVGSLTVDGSITWLNLGPTPPPTMEPRLILGADVLYNNGWLEMCEGITPEHYTLTSDMFPKRYSRIGPYFEVWPTPDNVYKVKVLGYQALNPFVKDTDTTTMDDQLIYLTAAGNAKSSKKFKQPDAPVYAKMALDLRVQLQAGDHGNKRYIPGAPRDVTRPVPVLLNPE